MYDELQKEIHSLLIGESIFISNAANFAAHLYHNLPDVNWVGFYLQSYDDLLLGPFQGQMACSRLPKGKGVCGDAAKTLQSIIVENVHAYTGHIACSPDSNSEIVIPLIKRNNFYGVLDIDSPIFNRFSEEDKIGLESLVNILMSVSDMTTLEKYYKFDYKHH
ncbi:MAG: GAF domain-containing protein [FCB group bacterium]|jgi:GAF domain-containing protein